MFSEICAVCFDVLTSGGFCVLANSAGPFRVEPQLALADPGMEPAGYLYIMQ